MKTKVLITGGAGYLGAKLVRRLSESGRFDLIVADIRSAPPVPELPGMSYHRADVREPVMAGLIERERPGVVVHLAAIVEPPRDAPPGFARSVDVEGTRNVLDACERAGTGRIVVTSSGAAYGYHADNPAWLSETDPLRGNDAFEYARNKRLVEEMLAERRAAGGATPEQVIFRIGTILGEGVRNQITSLFDRPWLPGVRGGDDRFVFIWDEDVVSCLERAIDGPVTGIFNVAGDGALPMAELARRMGKRHVRLPAGLIRAVLTAARPLGLTRHGPEQVEFLRYRPVLDNARLKSEFGFTPSKTSSEVFDFFLASR